jgi:hypothetical protein
MTFSFEIGLAVDLWINLHCVTIYPQPHSHYDGDNGILSFA